MLGGSPSDRPQNKTQNRFWEIPKPSICFNMLAMSECPMNRFIIPCPHQGMESNVSCIRRPFIASQTKAYHKPVSHDPGPLPSPPPVPQGTGHRPRSSLPALSAVAPRKAQPLTASVRVVCNYRSRIGNAVTEFNEFVFLSNLLKPVFVKFKCLPPRGLEK